MAKIKVQIDAALTGLAISADDIQAVLEIAANQALRLSSNKFKEQGPGWKPLAPRTIKRRRLGGAGAKILQDTGKLRNSVIVQNRDVDSIEVGSNLVYSGPHQFGTKNIPARPYIPTAEELLAAAIPKIVRFLNVR